MHQCTNFALKFQGAGWLEWILHRVVVVVKADIRPTAYLSGTHCQRKRRCRCCPACFSVSGCCRCSPPCHPLTAECATWWWRKTLSSYKDQGHQDVEGILNHIVLNDSRGWSTLWWNMAKSSYRKQSWVPVHILYCDCWRLLDSRWYPLVMTHVWKCHHTESKDLGSHKHSSPWLLMQGRQGKFIIQTAVPMGPSNAVH